MKRELSLFSKHWRCRVFGHLWVPMLELDEAMRKIYGSGGYRCSRCPYGSGSEDAFLKYLGEFNNRIKPFIH